jgi:hypothetical protein
MSVDVLLDLRLEFGEARDQGPRPTCMAFTASDAHAGVRAGWDPLSVEWAYYHAVRRDGANPDDGATLTSMLKVLEADGQPHETGWPYIARPILDPAVWNPPPRVYRPCSGATAIASPPPSTRSLSNSMPVCRC